MTRKPPSARAKSGNVAVFTAVAIVPMIGLVGLGLDMVRATAVQSEMQEAIDAAALAAARAQADGETDLTAIRAAAEEMFSANSARLGAGECGQMRVTSDLDDGLIDLKIDCRVDTMFPLIVAMDSWDLGVEAEVRYQRINLDVALMLDITGSMAGQKLATLKTAAKDLVDILTTPGASDNDIRIGLAPFSTTLNAGAYAAALTNTPGHPNSCVTERIGAQAYTGAGPAPGAYHAPALAWCPTAPLTPLTDDPVLLKARIDALNADGLTAGHLGVAFARYLMAPQWSGVWTGDSAPLPFSAANLKIMVLMTDGVFNTQYSALGTSSQQAAQLCAAAKAEGYVIYSVAYDAPAAAQTLLRNCASDPSKFFASSSGTALLAAYQQIATDLLRLRVTH